MSMAWKRHSCAHVNSIPLIPIHSPLLFISSLLFLFFTVIFLLASNLASLGCFHEISKSNIGQSKPAWVAHAFNSMISESEQED